MLTDSDKRILQLLGKNLLMTTGELVRALERDNGKEVSLQRLMELGYVEKVESIGTTLVVTQKGLRALKDKA